MKKIFIIVGIVVVVLFSFVSCSSNEIIDSTKSITIYDNLTYIEGAKYNTADLEKYNSHSVDNLKITYHDDLVLWKGDKFGILHLDNGNELNVKVSVYGDFFTVVGQKGHYTFKIS